MRQPSLIFSDEPQIDHIKDAGLDISIYDAFFPAHLADPLFFRFAEETAWRQDHVSFYGKSYPLPREQAWYGEPNTSYSYSGLTLEPLPWTQRLLDMKERVETVAETKFNSVLLNLYRNGKDTVSWHADDEPGLGATPVIASVSLGAERIFQMRPKYPGSDSRHLSIPLGHGSLLIMRGDTQKYWLHRVPRTTQDVGQRINLTWRWINK